MEKSRISRWIILALAIGGPLVLFFSSGYSLSQWIDVYATMAAGPDH